MARHVDVTAARAVVVGHSRAFQLRQQAAQKSRLDAVHQVMTEHARRVGQPHRVFAVLRVQQDARRLHRARAQHDCLGIDFVILLTLRIDEGDAARPIGLRIHQHAVSGSAGAQGEVRFAEQLRDDGVERAEP